MSKATGVIAIVLAFIGGFFLGQYVKKGGGEEGAVVAGPTAGGPGAEVERYKVPVGQSTVKGPAHAKVTIIEVSEFQCPFCSRVLPTLKKLHETYPKDVRIVFKHNPLPFHQDAPLASEAALAAGEQGKFWEMHDKLFANQQALKRENLEKYATELQLDMNKFKAALDQGKFKRQIQEDQQVAARFGARGTPSFFINGRPLRGAVPFEEFDKIVKEEIANANAALKKGAKLATLYDEITKDAKAAFAPPQPGQDKGQQRPQVAQADPSKTYKVPLGDSHWRGAKHPKVTIVQWSDFQCPFCSRVENTMKEIEKAYPGVVKIVWKDNALPFHQNAMPAAEACRAAGEQGKFWEMHAKLFENQKALDRPSLEKYAQELGLNLTKFKAALDTGKFKQSIQADMQLAGKLGARGTPAFFINGRFISGAQPFANFKQIIDAEVAKADELVKKGTPVARVYDELTKDGLAEAVGAPGQPPGPQGPRPGEPDPNTVYKVAVSPKDPIKGAKVAKVTMVIFSEFECPFCKRVGDSVAQVMSQYGKDVRLVWKNLPLPFHKNAPGAAEAAMAAHAQGKFWQMHDKLFENQKALDAASLEKYAQEIGLNLARFKADMEGHKYQAQVKAETEAGNKVGARGTPTFFINGRILVGAQPFDAFKAKIDEEIKKADELIKKGVPLAKLYDEIQKKAVEQVAAAPAGGPPGGGADERVVVDAGNAPSKGPKNAPVQIVEFSDFECPFCGRVVPTLKQIMDAYPGKVRVAFKQFPLPFHKNAPAASEAALAAHAQGRFWEMHDKLFQDPKNLTRETFEKYAQELGLNLAKFKADLDNKKFEAQVKADVEYGQKVCRFGTPTFFINGRKGSGAMPFDTFKQIIDEELKGGGKPGGRGAMPMKGMPIKAMPMKAPPGHGPGDGHGH
ncbi:MAG: thioredoxin domain-containing protein [Elusimicrobia bacterium]|nr:thioredoxin domain-containing protein [Elusimicrobiota bacterium]